MSEFMSNAEWEAAADHIAANLAAEAARVELADCQEVGHSWRPTGHGRLACARCPYSPHAPVSATGRYNTTVSGGPDTTDPHAIDWPARQARAVVPFGLDAAGLPVNPVEPDLPAGRGELWHWGEAVAADAIVTVIDSAGARWLLMVRRDDGHGWAVPGGCLDPGETAEAAVCRELAEETGLDLDAAAFSMRAGRYVPDPRAGRNAWMVTVPGVAVLHTDTPPVVVGTDDAAEAAWLPAGTYAELAAAVAARGGAVFGAHGGMLRALLDPRPTATV